MIKPKDVDYLPTSAGCYLFKDDKSKVLYVGKAKNIKKRVKSYFQKNDHPRKTRMLVERIKKIDFITTSTESEAFLLENNLIKLHLPKFNIDLKDSRRYAYLCLTKDTYPVLEVARIRDKKGEYFGPFTSGRVRKIVMDTVSRNFKILTKKPSPKLTKIIDKEEYKVRVSKVRKILQGKSEKLISELTKEMQKCASEENFEYAVTLRDQIDALNTMEEKQVMELSRSIDANIINYGIYGGEVYLLLFNVRKGVVEDKQEFIFDYYEDFLEDFLSQVYVGVVPPKEILLPTKVGKYLGEYLSKIRGSKVKISVPKKGEKKELLNFVYQNISATFFAGKVRMEELQKALSLPKVPMLIECFDISHLAGTNTVASMVAYENGFPKKSLYRKFKIKSNAGGDDLVAMKEATRRRYGGSLSKKMKFPDLIVIDGGKTQLSVVANVLIELKLKIPLISLAKEFEEIHTPQLKNGVRLNKNNKGLQMLINIRDEAHRFANAYRKTLKSREFK
ncbi:MAG: excinuclease ABC subunit UvrC [Candidatus Diapherotrites archaeon]|jgi:excinuclease ABC subunit C|uniref:Excinuclease ABC subunit UvrC n=1 Tax=Candidatus Iainarchaeum sp. TaxID=3101447 RepID=A0A8T5GE55_9ARCH|nr:excinuclease ABC subunit UvrC [Candidatus Diapherotrites archaeon]MBT7241426.1 excinuclease ABC subunit UvrC [Candidatus Diapherotrites archaeon]